MKQKAIIPLREVMGTDQGWGRQQGRVVYHGLLDFVEGNPGNRTFGVSLAGVRRIDVSFASETVVELARRYRGQKGFYLTDLDDPDMAENWDAAAIRKNQPLMVWTGDESRLLGPEPTAGTLRAFEYAVKNTQVKASSFAAKEGISLQNASMKLKKLWEQGFMLRREEMADSGGVEYLYHAIR